MASGLLTTGLRRPRLTGPTGARLRASPSLGVDAPHRTGVAMGVATGPRGTNVPRIGAVRRRQWGLS